LGLFPTPVEPLPQIARRAGLDQLHIKRDDLSGTLYGGNKVRKLEFLLGEAIRTGAKDVYTVGFAGSNHALATALYARKLGLASTSLLMDQANARYVRRNLLASLSAGAELRHVGSTWGLAGGLMAKKLEGLIGKGPASRFIPGGGTCPLGITGYVNAAFELKDQINEGLLPKPDLIYVPLGSMGTAAGLMIGLAAAGLACRVAAVRVIEEQLAPPGKMLHLLRETVGFLRKRDPSFPRIEFAARDLIIRNEFLGSGYARFTPKGVEAAKLLREESGIPLNGTYSAKAFAAILDDSARGALKGKAVLFWNTYNSRNLSDVVSDVDYHRLPQAFHPYFETPVQPLDTF
jgi:D-cysteine desulfhydrase